MDYILHYTGTVPKYVDVCIDTIKKIDPESNITFLNNSDFQNDNALSINTKDISDQYLENFLNINYFQKKKTNYGRLRYQEFF